MYPKILLDSFIISLPRLGESEESGILASLDNMIGAFPAKHYSGFFSSNKNKANKYHIKYRVHDILKCKMPEFALIDGSEKGYIFAGQPLEMDKRAAKVMGFDWKTVDHLKLVDESFSGKKEDEKGVDDLIKES